MDGLPYQYHYDFQVTYFFMFGTSSDGLNFYGDWGSPKDFIYGAVALTLLV